MQYQTFPKGTLCLWITTPTTIQNRFATLAQLRASWILNHLVYVTSEHVEDGTSLSVLLRNLNLLN